MASTLYLQLPPKSVVEQLGRWEDQTFLYCLLATDKNILQQGRHSFNSLRELVHSSERLVLLVSSSDVNFCQVAVPPMPFAKLKNALPNLLEEQLLSDTNDLLFVPEHPVNGQCKVAVIAKSWVEQLVSLGVALGAQKISAHAISSGLPLQAESATVLVESTNLDQLGEQILEISVRAAGQLGSGLTIALRDKKIDDVDVATQIQQTIKILLPQGAINYFVAPELEAVLSKVSATEGDVSPQVQYSKPDWKTKISGLSTQTLDLFSTFNLEGKQSFDWAKWRWTLILSSSIVLISLFALNWKWMSLRTEANTIQDSIQAIYQSAFPKEPVSRDPLFQMQQKINAAKKMAGESSNDDFLVLSAQFAAAWGQLVPGQPTATVASIEYRERSLFIQPKNLAEVPVDQLTSLLKELGLKLEVKDTALKLTVDLSGIR